MSLRRHSSRPLPLLAVGALLAVPLLSSCGFDYATDRVNTISAGVNDRSGQVDVLGAVVIAGEDNRGVFAATLANNSLTDDDALTGMSQIDDEAHVAPIDPATVATDVPANSQVNLFDTSGIGVQGSFAAGDFVEVTLEFESGQTTTMLIPVVTPCHQYSPEKLTNLVLPSAEPGLGEDIEAGEDEMQGQPGPYSCETEISEGPAEGIH